MDDLDAVAAVLPCDDLDDTVAFFERLGFRLEVILPADDPAVAIVAGHGLRLRVQCGDPPSRALDPLPTTPWIGRAGEGAWKTGRAGMQYRDLVPDRRGGRVIASQIRIDDGGEVRDYVHWHEIELQLIYCRRGWVRVVYEDQGPPFVLHPGDCVLQPPRIRHRVLECSAGLEVIEIGAPAVHETRVDHELALPTSELHPDRDFGGQRFVRHEQSRARWQDDVVPGFHARELGIAEATQGRASARVLRPAAMPAARTHRGDAITFVLAGRIRVHLGDGPEETLASDDVLVVPAGLRHRFSDASEDLELLELVLPRR
jgi:quercetin dioxygenase-like cupin family protein